MVRSAIALLALSTALAADIKPFNPADIRGLDPSYLDKYTPVDGYITCLDGSKRIPVSAINDDYCDCPDGSDEPGTSACEGVGEGWFYCKNEGHIPGRVRRSRVNDGICDPECCDGSDEWQTGVCQDRCEAIGREHRQKAEAELKTRKTGAKLRGTYINWAVKERRRLEEELSKKREEVKTKEIEVDHTRAQLEKTEARSKEDLEKRKQSALYTHLLSQKLALTRLRSKTSRLQGELDTLHNLLSELSKGYNPNGQDMAVKAAVVGYEEFLKGDEPTTPAEGEDAPSVPDIEEEITDRELDEIDRKDLDGLLLSEMIGEDDDEEEGGILYRIDEYIPDALYDQWESVRDFAIDWMIRIGFLGRGSKAAAKSASEGPHVAAAREKHNKANGELNKLRTDITNAEETLRKMEKDYGPEAEWKKLDGTCIDTVAGDYTYELCLFGKATQKSNRDSSSNHLGTFTEWKTDEAPGTYEYYTRQYYRNGSRCWNGPMRSVTVDWSCGTTNAIQSVAEPEKCEYFFKATTPALCWPVEETSVKDEL
ncbi:glucosidase II beta subunit-like-domain-containing protein [Papiliotrema laurentii]|uniref:Glucosidase 2 subunit beta n=1 Tax=Papiliotrema laurentii TaxID=5418 RepID=A0AAD9CV11_PAPLA|nr:glucosidase II beta subunit-like-domain-containing protein [Papiliotrema laurentii]